MAEYQKALVTFIDILGFRNLVMDAGDSGAQKVDGILTILLKLKEISKLGRSVTDRGVVRSVTRSMAFSDCIVRVNFIHSERLYWAVDAEIALLGNIQPELACRGVLIRGGISFGDLYIGETNDVLFGPALVRAYELSENHAIYSRIILDSMILERVGTEDLGLMKDGDGIHFVDYLWRSCGQYWASTFNQEWEFFWKSISSQQRKS